MRMHRPTRTFYGGFAKGRIFLKEGLIVKNICVCTRHCVVEALDDSTDTDTTSRQSSNAPPGSTRARARLSTTCMTEGNLERIIRRTAVCTRRCVHNINKHETYEIEHKRTSFEIKNRICLGWGGTKV